jgi:dienelactone hydrolase
MASSRRIHPLLAGLVTTLVSLAAAGAAAAPSANVTFAASDGVQISGTYYSASRRPAPAVILLHMLTRTRDDWDLAGNRLADSGMAVLAIDFRSRADPTSFVLDVQAARQYLTGRTDVIQSAIGIAGASVGAHVAVLVAAGDPAIRSLALLSPGLDYRGLRIDAAMRKYAERPALLVASDEDPYAFRSVHQLAALGSGRRELRLLNNAGHGTIMLNRASDLLPLLIDWFSRTLS